jgi:hypothetical protein
MTDREAMQIALEALEYEAQKGNDNAYEKERSALRTALSRKALDELAEIDRELGLDRMHPDLARVGEVGVWGEPVIDKSAAKRIATQLGWEPKREWQSLGLHEVKSCWLGRPARGWPPERILKFYKEVDAKLKEKNHG